MNELKLEPVTKKMLNYLRGSTRFLPVYDMDSDLAEMAVWEAGKVLLDRLGLPMVQFNQYRWFLRELSKVLRKQTGWELATELEICMRKWAAHSLDGRILQALVRECVDRLDGMTAETLEDRASSPKSEARMTIEARRPNGGEEPADAKSTGQRNCSAEHHAAGGQGTEELLAQRPDFAGGANAGS